MKKRNSLELRRQVVEHVRVQLDGIVHLPTHNDYMDYIRDTKRALQVTTAFELGHELVESGNFLFYHSDIREFLEEIHDVNPYHLNMNSKQAYDHYIYLVGQAIQDIEKDRFPLAGA